MLPCSSCQPLIASPIAKYKYTHFPLFVSMASANKLCLLILMVVLSNTGYFVCADPDPLQDICVADLTSVVKMNGFACKPTFNASDLFFTGLVKPELTNNLMGSNVTSANVSQIPGLNTQGVAMARIDYAPGGLNPPHTHPRATEILFVLYGELDVGFITTSNVLVSKSIKQGEIFIFPRGLVHFQINNGKVPAAAIPAFNSQFPGAQYIASTLFTATPPVPNHVLAIAFQFDTKEVDIIKSKLATKQ